MDTKEYIISIFEIDAEGKITSHSTVGQADYHIPDVIQLWKFINVYWIYGPELLMPTHVQDVKSLYQEFSYLNYCNQVQSKAEIATNSWSRIRLVHHYNVVFALLCFPYDVLHLIGRKICLKRRNMPKWNQHIEQKNKVNPNDPYIVTSKDNFNFNVFGMKKR